MMFLKESLEANFCYVCVAVWQVGSIDDWTQRNKVSKRNKKHEDNKPLYLQY